MQYYTIKALYRIDSNAYTLAEFTLTQDNKWALATNTPQRFQTIGQARRYAEKHKIVENRPRLGSDSCPYIVGPKGGKYSIFGGK